MRTTGYYYQYDIETGTTTQHWVQRKKEREARIAMSPL